MSTFLNFNVSYNKQVFMPVVVLLFSKLQTMDPFKVLRP